LRVIYNAPNIRLTIVQILPVRGLVVINRVPEVCPGSDVDPDNAFIDRRDKDHTRRSDFCRRDEFFNSGFKYDLSGNIVVCQSRFAAGASEALADSDTAELNE
jgi:hypothetical protein